jgi:hypothetical protein
MQENEYLYVIGIGVQADWEAGQGSLYYIEDRNGERAMPVWTTAEAAERYAEANFGPPEAHMAMLESVGAASATPLTEGRFVLMPFATDGLARAAAIVGADYLIRDPRPGGEQEILRLT